MRLAVLTDVHGNAFALEAVLADIRAAAPEALYNLGDTVWGAADPGRAWALQQEFAPPSVRGNTDEFMLSALSDLQPATRLYREFVESQLGGVPPELRHLPVSLSVADGEVLLSHGSPRDPWEYLMLSGGSLATPEELKERLHGTAARVVVVGHSHTELLDTPGMAERRKQFQQAETAHRPPFVLRGDELSSTTFWHGKLLNQRARSWVQYQTEGLASYAVTGMEDTGILQALTFLAAAELVDLGRVLILRGASNYDQQRQGISAAQSLAETKVASYSAYLPTLENLHRVGHRLLERLLREWPAMVLLP